MIVNILSIKNKQSSSGKKRFVCKSTPISGKLFVFDPFFHLFFSREKIDTERVKCEIIEW